LTIKQKESVLTKKDKERDGDKDKDKDNEGAVSAVQEQA